MENLKLWLIGGLFIYFVIIPAFVFILCVRKKSGKWYIKKWAVLKFLLFLNKGDTPKNTCYLYVDAVLAAYFVTIVFVTIVLFILLFIFFLFSFFFCGIVIVYVIASAIIEHPKTFLALLLSIKFIAALTWKIWAYTKIEAWLNQKEKTKDQINKFFQVFQKIKQKASNKVCIKFENV